jgi:hypothetical protein
MRDYESLRCRRDIIVSHLQQTFSAQAAVTAIVP